jgi:hypothetical protein
MLSRPLKLNVPVGYYSSLYTTNHTKFCRRFIATIFHRYFPQILDMCVRNNITSTLLEHELIDTDNYLCIIRDDIDNFNSYDTVREAIVNDSIHSSLEQLVSEIVGHRTFLDGLWSRPKSHKNEIDDATLKMWMNSL